MRTSKTLSRRAFLSPGRAPDQPTAAATVATPRLIVLNLRGGLDALALLGPYGNTTYNNNRSFTKIDDPALSGANSVFLTAVPEPIALPVKAQALLTPWAAGDLAFVVQTGSVFSSFSHFSKQDYLELGDVPDCLPSNGWLARFLDLTNPPVPSPRAVAFAPSRPLVLQSQLPDAQKVVAAIDPLALAFPGPAAAPYAPAYANTTELLAALGVDPLKSVAASLFEAFDYFDQLSQITYVPAGGATYGADPIGQQLRAIAAMCNTPIGSYAPDVFHVDVSSFDTHDNEDLFSGTPGTLGDLLEKLSNAMEAFYLDMAAHGTDYVLVTVTEFGRRVMESASNGTDHGDASLMMVMGPSVDGGKIKGSWGGLGGLVLGNLPVTVDYRDVIGEILIDKRGVTPTQLMTSVFPGCSGSPYTYSSHNVIL